MTDDSTGLILDRETLYDLVWSKPSAYLAKDYGISDVMLTKVCRSLDVPKPPPGYWAKVRSGKKLPRPALPPESAATRREVAIRPQSERAAKPEARTKGPEVAVPAQLRRPHRLIAQAAGALRSAKPDQDGMLFAYARTAARIEVSEAKRELALRIMDSLFKALEKRGYPVAAESSDRASDTTVTIQGEKVGVRLRERLTRVPHVITGEEERRFVKYGFRPSTKYDHKPTGELQVIIYRLDYRYGDSRWRDSKRRPLEQQVGDIVVGIEEYGAKLRQERIEREEARRREAEAAQRRWEEQRRREEEARRFKELQDQAGRWLEAKKLRAYLRAVERSVPFEERSEDLASWLEWAKDRIDEFDPLTPTG